MSDVGFHLNRNTVRERRSVDVLALMCQTKTHKINQTRYLRGWLSCGTCRWCLELAHSSSTGAKSLCMAGTNSPKFSFSAEYQIQKTAVTLLPAKWQQQCPTWLAGELTANCHQLAECLPVDVSQAATTSPARHASQKTISF